MTEIRGVCADWLGICADSGKGKMKGSPNLLCSSDFFFKKSCIYFLLFRSCMAQTASASGKSSEDLKFSQSKNSTLFFFPFACIQLALRKACGRMAARNRENRCCMGRQSEGSTRKGVRRTGLRNSRPLFAARVHFAPSTS